LIECFHGLQEQLASLRLFHYETATDKNVLQHEVAELRERVRALEAWRADIMDPDTTDFTSYLYPPNDEWAPMRPAKEIPLRPVTYVDENMREQKIDFSLGDEPPPLTPEESEFIAGRDARPLGEKEAPNIGV
jgi:hypothetical protein